MVRETRGSTAAREAADMPTGQSPLETDLGSKRKRRTSSAQSIPEPTDANGNERPDSKRQRVGLHANGKGSEDDIQEEKPNVAHRGRLLTKEMRDAIAIVISQMAAGLPPPINKVLTLWLPPDFVQKDENTLGWILQQDGLTWERLVQTLHLFSEHLLLPCAYPNPVPSLERFHLPVPPLPSHFAPLTVYSFCRAVYQLLLQVEAQLDEIATASPSIILKERWALMQKTPGNGIGTAGGEWFTAATDLREVEATRKRLHVESNETVLESLVSAGDKFGNAQPVMVQATEPLGNKGKSNVPSLSDAIIRRASLKAQRWKDTLSSRRKNGFANVLHSVTVPRVSGAAFTPTFGPMYDSLTATGMGYHSTLDLMHERRRRHKFASANAKIVEIDDDEEWNGTLTDQHEDEADTAATERLEHPDNVLAANARRINELQDWQEVRVCRGDGHWMPKREQAVAEELFASLVRLVESSNTPPSKLLPTTSEPQSIGLAHVLARRLLSSAAPIIRGTLDPRRPQALHDNVTIQLRAQAVAAIGSAPTALNANGAMPSPHAPPPKALPGTPGYVSAPSSSMREPPPHTLPSGGRYYSQGRAPYPSPGTPQSHHHQPQQQQQQQQSQGHQPQQLSQQHSGSGHVQQPHTPHQHQIQSQQAHPGSNVPMVASPSPAQLHNMRTAMINGMPVMPQAYSPHGSTSVQHAFRPPSAGANPVAHQPHMGANYSRQPLTAAAAVAAGLSPGASPSPLPGYSQRMVGVPMGPSGLRQPYGMPGTPGTPGTPGGHPQHVPQGALYPNQHPSQQNYGGHGRVATGMTGLAMPGMPGHQMSPQMVAQMNAQMAGQMNVQMGAHMSNQMSAQLGAQMPGQMGSQMGAQMSVPMANQMAAAAQMSGQLGAMSGRLGGQMPGQMPGQLPGQMSGQMPGQVPGQMAGQMPGQMPNQLPMHR